jgi:hypothetical protein
MKRMLLVLAVIACAFAVGASTSAGASGSYPNCKALNKRYPHGVGRVGAHDHTASGNPVTNFRRSNRLYRFNSRLDRDNDGIACEKH